MRVDNEFLPAALEILETPASPIRTALIWFICLLTASALIWSYIGTFDIVATAQGKIQPTGRVKVIQSIEVGKTIAVPVSNGAKVEAGDILVELDPTGNPGRSQHVVHQPRGTAGGGHEARCGIG
ncbi:hypothetical protein ACOJBO_03620 [Rhizobium beringeri]